VHEYKGHYINGTWTAPGGDLAEVLNPATEEVLALIAEGDKATRKKDYEGALAHYRAANQATPSWRASEAVDSRALRRSRASRCCCSSLSRRFVGSAGI